MKSHSDTALQTQYKHPTMALLFRVHHFLFCCLLSSLLVTFQYSYERYRVNNAEVEIESTDPKLLLFLPFTHMNISIQYF